MDGMQRAFLLVRMDWAMPVALQSREVTVTLRRLFPAQAAFVSSKAKRKVVKAGRRSGKTVGAATLAVQRFLAEERVLYAVPTAEQLEAFWFEVCRALQPVIDLGVFTKNETEHYIERKATQQRLKAKTAWNADTLRGDFGGLLLIDEWQLCNEDLWGLVGAPMLLDRDGDAVFLFTPPSLHAAGVSKAHDPQHAVKFYREAQADASGRWAAFHFTSHDNPHISRTALAEITKDMSLTAYRQEILAEDSDIPDTALVYRQFSFATCAIPGFPVPGAWPRYVGHDFGGANPAALLVAQDPSTGYFYAYREYLPGAGRSAGQHVAEFKRLTQGVTVVRRVGGSHQEEEVRQAYTAQGWPIQEPGLQRVEAGIDKVRAVMEKNKLFVFKDECPRLIEELANYSFKVAVDGTVTDEIQDKARYHLLDCLRYVAADWRPDLVEGKPRKVINVMEARARGA